jgi:ABC-type sugar transport system ATPase subunit
MGLARDVSSRSGGLQASGNVLEARGITKAYGAVRALDGVDFAVSAGSVEALLGQNGAGKSTLMKVLAGAVVPDTGSITVNGASFRLGSPEAAENVLMGHWPARVGLVDWARLRDEACTHLERVGLDVDPRTPVRTLGMAERQQVELAKVLAADARVLLLDEPTSALSERESGRLFEIIRALVAEGVAIVYVTHHLPEALAISDNITVLRDGRQAGQVRRGQASESQLVQMMLGHSLELGQIGRSRRSVSNGDIVLRAFGLARPPRLKPIDLDLHKGEIVAVFGLVGSGRTRLARTLFGLEPATEGALELWGQRVRIRKPRDAIAHRMGYVGEDRAAGVVPQMSVEANITLASLRAVSKGSLLNTGAARRLAGRFITELAIKAGSPDQPVGSLSGGNQQKVVLARWMCSGAKILVLDDPMRGIDVGAKEDVFRLLAQLREAGVAILYITSDLSEAKRLADRLLVMFNGQVVREFEPNVADEAVMATAGGLVV